MSPFNIYYLVKIPSKLHLDRILQEHKINVDYYAGNPDKIKDRAALILGQIERSLRQKEEGKSISQFAPLCSGILGGFVRDYKKYIDYFIKHRVLVSDESYQANSGKGRCKQYRFNEERYSGDQWKPYYIYDKKIIEKVYNKTCGETRKKYPHQYESLKHLDFNESELKDVLNAEYTDNELKSLERLKLNKLKNEKHWTYKTGKTNRLYTPITNIKKEVRKLLRYKGENLVEVDVVNSIPFFSLVLLNPKTILKSPVISKMLVESNPDIFGEVSHNTKGLAKRIYHFYEGSLVEFGLSIETLSEAKDVITFSKLVASGKIYEFMASVWSNKKEKLSRKQAKKELIQILNSPSSFESQNRILLKNKFPNVMSIFESLNQGYTKVKRGKGLLQWEKGDLECPFAMFTQRLEAWFMLDIVSSRITEKHTHCPILTIHDSFMVMPEYRSLVKNIIKDSSFELFGKHVNTN